VLRVGGAFWSELRGLIPQVLELPMCFGWLSLGELVYCCAVRRLTFTLAIWAVKGACWLCAIFSTLVARICSVRDGFQQRGRGPVAVRGLVFLCVLGAGVCSTWTLNAAKCPVC
jgi:hypothetical protein